MGTGFILPTCPRYLSLRLAYTYTNGHLTNVVLSNHIPVFNLKSEDNNGHTSSVTVLGLTRNYGFTVSGLPTSRSLTVGSQTYQSLTYNFNAATGNLTSVYNACNGLTENYTYDNLHRLTSYGGTSVEYDSKGNITEKGDIGSFAYNTTGKPYAVSDVTLTGSLPVGTQYVSYYSFDRPSMISDNGYSATFTYNGSYDRVKMEMLHNSQNTLTRYYLGGCYELDEKPTGNMEKLYLLGGYYDSPLVLVKQNGSTSYNMILRDHLGSITRIMGQEELSYDAWGRLRNPSTYEPYTPGSEPTLYLGRGYCGHEYLPEFGLINMNARLYDPLLGRFLSPDPYVQAPEHSQSFNRYSYCMNNPLKYTDISGEWFGIDDLVACIVGGVVNLGTNLISGNIHSIGHGISSFVLGAVAGETALYGQVEVSAFLVGAGNSIINQGFTNGWNNISWGNAFLSGGMSVAFSAIGSEISSIYSNQVDQFFGGISNDLLRNTLSSGTISSMTGFTIEGGLTLINGGSLSDALGAGLQGAELGFASGAISGMGAALSLKNNQKLGRLSSRTNVEESFFDNAQYTDKVYEDMQMGDFHSFPESVKAFENHGIKTTLIGNDGNVYQKLEIPGWYKGHNGNFEFIKNRRGGINHRFFKPVP